ncbi:MAG: hypothetical protein IKJ95_00915 [Bacteroidaceae bacterium]|nr:hypothetical protein [Bacteroidaceae bacterium]
MSSGFFELLSAVTVDCKDNGVEFVVSDRLKAIERLLKDTQYSLVASSPLALLFAKRRPQKNEKVVLISSHVDCVYSSCFCRDEGDCWQGTFDNSFGNAAVLWCMINGTLPENAVVAFTGDEEKNSHGALQALQLLGEMECLLASAIVQDVTNVGWESGALFTIENDSGFDLLTAYNIVSSLEPCGGKFAFKHDAEPDESWDYAEYGIPSLTLCAPVNGNMHSDAGVLLRKDSAEAYCMALALLAEVLC